MDKTKKEKIAIFRYGVIFPLIDSNNGWGDKEKLLNDIVEKEWNIPYTDKTYLCRATVINWLGKYRDGGQKIESLYPKDRLDRGFSRSLSPEVIDALVKLRMDCPKLTIQRLIEKSRASKIFPPGKTPSDSTIYRLLKKHSPKKSKTKEDMKEAEEEIPDECGKLFSLSICKKTSSRKGISGFSRSRNCWILYSKLGIFCPA